MKVFIKGLNTCTMRKQKLQQYKEFILANGHEIVSSPDKSHIIFLWTCAFRKDVRDNSLAEIRRYGSLYNAELIVGGCLPEIAPEMLKEIFNGKIIPWRDDSLYMEKIFGIGKKKNNEIDSIFIEEKLCDDPEQYRCEHPGEDAAFHDKFIKLVITEGCQYECSYCAEKLAFPPFKSFNENSLIKALKKKIEKTGVYDVALMGDCTGAYGRDIGSSFPRLLRQFLAKINPDIKFALVNYNLADYLAYFDEMNVLLKMGVFCHLNVPIQSASEHVLQLMQRPYTKSDMEKFFKTLLDHSFTAFDTHLIVGFPGETQKDLEESINFLLKYRPRHVLLSKYMDLPHLPSSKLDNKLNEEVKTKRAKMAEEAFTAFGIICNTDSGDIMKSKFKRMNNIAIY